MNTTARLHVLFFLLLGAHAHSSLLANEQEDPPKEVEIRQVGIQLETKTGKLEGTLDLPEGDGPFPVLIIHVGSGPVDRDGNWPGAKVDYLKRLGHALAGHRIAVLRYDRRGIGKSVAAKEEDFRFEMLVDDMAEWVKVLRKDRRFSRIGIMGHSQGSLVGILAAQKVKIDAFVSLAGVGRRTHEVLSEQYSKNLPAIHGAIRGSALAKEADKILNELAAGRTVSELPKELAADFRPSVQPFLISLFKYDPASELAKLKVPMLIVQGTSDKQHKVDEARLLASANKKDAELCVIEGMNHLLTTPLGELLAGNTPLAPLASGLIDRTSAFLEKTLRDRR